VYEFVDASSERLCGFNLDPRHAFFCGTNHQSNFAFGGVSLEGLEKFHEPAAAEFFVDLGDFAGEAGLTVA